MRAEYRVIIPVEMGSFFMNHLYQERASELGCKTFLESTADTFGRHQCHGYMKVVVHDQKSSKHKFFKDSWIWIEGTHVPIYVHTREMKQLNNN